MSGLCLFPKISNRKPSVCDSLSLGHGYSERREIEAPDMVSDPSVRFGSHPRTVVADKG